jgi:hypothetical protein
VPPAVLRDSSTYLRGPGEQVRCDAAAWCTLLPAPLLRRWLARLFETLCARLVAAVLRLRDISVDEAAAIQQLLARVLQGDALRGGGGGGGGGGVRRWKKSCES